jgi:hypothetical protein
MPNPAHWAVVIGINNYWTPTACLKGAVQDALRMREWLLDEDGGQVPQQNLFLLLRPAPKDEDPRRKGLSYVDATRDNLVDMVDRLLTRSEGRAKRLFFHFSGHGLMSQVSASNEDALVMADFTPLLTDHSMSRRSLCERFLATRFLEQFFFLDACRNIPWEGRFEIGKWPAPRDPDPALPAVQQYIFHATSAGVRAAEVLEAGNERGAFTEALLQGLRRTEMNEAKDWCIQTRRYEVRVNRLFDFVRDAVRASRLQVGNNTAASQLIQEPSRSGENRDNPLLVAFEAEGDEKLDLDVTVKPPEVVATTTLKVKDLLDDVYEKRVNLTGPTARFQLPPRQYVVRAEAPEYLPARPEWVIEVYRSGVVLPVILLPRPAQLTDWKPVVSISEERTQQPSRLTVSSTDPFAVLEVVDSAGRLHAQGLVRLDCVGLEDGVYVVRQRTPEGEVVAEEGVSLQRDKAVTVELQAPAPTDSELISTLASAPLSTLLTFASSAVNEDQPWGSRLHALGLRSFRQSVVGAENSGAEVLLADESRVGVEARQYLGSVQVRVWPAGQAVPDAALPPLPAGADNRAAFASAVASGSHWCSLAFPGQSPVVIALAVLPQRLTLLIVHWDIEGRLRIFQYHPALTPEERNRRKQSGPGGQEQPGAVEARMLRQVDLLQRYYVGDYLLQSEQTADKLLSAKWGEPVAGCLGGYLMLRLGKPYDLGLAASNMVGYFDGLADSHVLDAECKAAFGHYEESMKAWGRALDRGIPICAEGLARLYQAVRRHGIQHANTALLARVAQNRVPGLLWSAWPPALVPGARVED